MFHLLHNLIAGRKLVKQTEAQRRTARIAGWFFVVTFVTSIPEVFLYRPLLKHTDYVLGSGAHIGIALGATLEVLLAISGIATAVVLYPIIKRQSQSISLGYVASRTLESTIIVVGIISVMSVVTLRHDVGGAGAANAASLVLVERALVAIHDWTFLLGPGFCAGLRKRAVARLLDVQVRPRASGHGHAGSHRRSLDLRFGDRDPLRRFQERLPGSVPPGDFRKSRGKRRSASTSSSKGSEPSPILAAQPAQSREVTSSPQAERTARLGTDTRTSVVSQATIISPFVTHRGAA